MSDEMRDIFAWQMGIPTGAVEPMGIWPDTEYWWGIFYEYYFSPGNYAYSIAQSGADKFVGSLRGWFDDVHKWIVSKWGQLHAWFEGIKEYIRFLWRNLTDAMIDLYVFIGNKVKSIFQVIDNWAGILWTWLVSGIWSIINAITGVLVDLYTKITSTLAEWFETIRATIVKFFEDPFQWVLDLGAEIWGALKYLAAQMWSALIVAANVAAAWIGEKIVAVAPVLVEYFRDLAVWFWELIKGAFFFVKDQIAPAVAEATSGALGWLKDQFTHIMGLAYKELTDQAGNFIPMTPERAPKLAAIMFGSAVGFGALAHGIALGVEAIPNIKYMGVHYLSAFAARMGSFGTIAAATMGVIAAVALRRPMTYYMHSVLRPIQPSAGDLMMMAVKPDITPATFRRGMAYEGYSNFWIDAFQKTMYHEPRYFELSMMAEDESATAKWLYVKARRSGYSEDDSKIFVTSIAKKASRTQRQDYYKQAFNLFKEGYISRATFKTYLENLDMRPEAQEFAIAGADFAYQYDLFRDLVSAHRTAFRRDLITEDELAASLSALGLNPDRVDAIVYIEWAKKTPSAVKKERKEIAKEWAAVQKKYTTLYIEAFRRDLIDEGDLATYLIALGVKEMVARATARYEAIKRVPKPKYEEVGEYVLPPPPEPPLLEE